jgi:hypothetical protein
VHEDGAAGSLAQRLRERLRRVHVAMRIIGSADCFVTVTAFTP